MAACWEHYRTESAGKAVRIWYRQKEKGFPQKVLKYKKMRAIWRALRALAHVWRTAVSPVPPPFHQPK